MLTKPCRGGRSEAGWLTGFGRRCGWWLLLVLVLVLGTLSLRAQPAEERAFTALTKMFEDGLYEFAARDAAEFAARFPESPRRAEAGLLQAQALLELGRFEEALARLGNTPWRRATERTNSRSGKAEARLRQGDPVGAAQAFTQFLETFPASPRRLEAAVQQARALYRLGDLATASAYLRDPAGAFQTAARANPTHPWAQQGWLLSAELLLGLNDLAAAEAALAQMAEAPLSPPAAWERQLLLARVHLVAARLPEALGCTTNLWNSTTNLISRELLAEAAALQGSLFEALQQTDAALQAYERNLGTNVPSTQRRFALEKVVGLSRQQGPNAAAQRLQAFIDRLPQDELLDLARFALGEARLAEYHRLLAAPAPVPPEALAARTNALAQARTQFEWVLANRPESPLAGRAELNRGWCLWEEGGARLTEALTAFRAAAGRLAPSTDQANARFKWADCQARTGDLAGALTNYWLVATNHLEARIPDTLRSEALFQVVRTSLQAGELGMAAAAVQRLAQQEGGGELAQSAELLLARAFSQRGQPEPARAQYEAFLQRYTNSTLIPDVRLAIARTFEQRGDFGAALASYASWLSQYTNTPGVSTSLVAQAVFDHARLSFRTRPDAAAGGAADQLRGPVPGSLERLRWRSTWWPTMPWLKATSPGRNCFSEIASWPRQTSLPARSFPTAPGSWPARRRCSARAGPTPASTSTGSSPTAPCMSSLPRSRSRWWRRLTWRAATCSCSSRAIAPRIRCPAMRTRSPPSPRWPSASPPASGRPALGGESAIVIFSSPPRTRNATTPRPKPMARSWNPRPTLLSAAWPRWRSVSSARSRPP
ncbi:MAG: tetratricopeptide repeat protein [Verrucomicrobia bacterium]|nr:tetratricopeptide repeat protein [Verrucomicrobiota bacterium]